MSALARIAACTELRSRVLLERGLTTVEYAIGLLAAAAAALVLLRIFNEQPFFEMLYQWVVNVFVNIAKPE